MKIFLPYLLLAFPFGLAAQSYNTLLIPDSLRKNARVVEREEEITLEIKSPAKAIMRERHVFTIINETGNNFGGNISGYDKFISISSLSGTLYDSTGKELKHVKKKDMADRSYVEGLIDDYRYKEFNFYCRTYPYTVEYSEEDEFNGIQHFDNWDPLPSSGIATQHSKYVIIAPKDYQVRYKPVNCSIQPVITETGDKRTYTWEAKNLSSKSLETEGPQWKEVAPHVLLAPSNFEVEGYKGNMSSWKDYGKFINQLRDGRDILPEDIKKKVHELTDKLKDPKDKVYALYDFLQKNTRYVSIQLGIGGWQPFPADFVATKRYGDCKALSNYMVALLKEAGIVGKYVEIWAGSDAPEIIEDFPCSQGNHVITCVPLNKDTIWLECTSSTSSPGYMGSFTGGRKAILIDEEGGHVVKTPSYSSSDNLQRRVVNAEISSEGNLEAEVNTLYSGLRQEIPQSLMNEASADEREKYLNALFNLPTYKVDKSKYTEQRAALPTVSEYLHVVSPNYASVSGKRLFIVPDLFDKNYTRLSSDSNRHYDFINKEALKDIDSITIKIPDGYRPESVPQDMNIDSKFGKYSSSVKVLPNKIIYYRSNEKCPGHFPASDYPGLVKYHEQIYKADRGSIVLIKKE